MRPILEILDDTPVCEKEDGAAGWCWCQDQDFTGSDAARWTPRPTTTEGSL